MMKAEQIKKQILQLGNPETAARTARFFKTGKGEYGEGDRFVGATVPEIRSVANSYKNLPLNEIKKLLQDKIHDCRHCALMIMVHQFKNGNEIKRHEIYELYLANTAHINNWDLVDVSAKNIVGTWLIDKKRDILYELAQKELWEQRIAMVATHAFIKEADFEDTIRLCELFLTHPHDLMHKACGWMLREVGKQNEKTLTDFLETHASKMPRTMLRYSIEKLTPEQRHHYMKR